MKTTETASIMYCGVDVSKSFLDLDGLDKPMRFANTAEGLASLLKALPASARLVCEASGGYESALCAAAWAARRPVSVVSPDRVRAYARSRGQFAKTDRLDAAILSAYGRERQPAAPNPTRARLKALLRAREHVLSLQRLEQNHREHLAEAALVQTHSDERLKQYAQQLHALEKAIRELIAADGHSREQTKRMQAVDGVGEITAWTVWADLPEIGTLNPGQPAALSGLAPMQATAASTRACTASATDAPRRAASSTWQPSLPASTTPCSRNSTSDCAKRANLPRSPSSPSPVN